MIHIEGMGWLGSVLAVRLEQRHIPFTWNDTEAEICAWPASTGLIYPAGDKRSRVNLAIWRKWVAAGDLIGKRAAPVRFVHAYKQPPHSASYHSMPVMGNLRMAHADSYSVSVAEVVTAARERFALRRTEGPARGQRLVRAHGFTERLESYVWGWSAPARLDFGRWHELGPYIALHGKLHRFQTVNAYPVPGHQHHLIGSSSVTQASPHANPAAALAARDRWVEAFGTVYPELRVIDIGEPQQGWRPRGHDGDDLSPTVDVHGRITLPSLYHSGVRWAPTVIERVIELCAD